jgi:hypothetical protein
VTNLLPGSFVTKENHVKFEALEGLKRIPNFNYRLGGAPTPGVDRGQQGVDPKPAPKPMTEVELSFIMGDHKPKK